MSEVIEVEAPPTGLEGASESWQSIAAHPGLSYLRYKLRLSAAAVEKEILQKAPDSLYRVGFLQGVLSGLSFVERAVRQATPAAPASRPASTMEEKAFQEAKALLEEVR